VLLDVIRAEIERVGPMPFDRFMEVALYDPEGGYFTAGGLRSEKAGDFLTSPELSPRFGSTLARFVAAERDRVGDPFTIVDVGAGTGSLLGPVLEALDVAVTSFAVEVSPAARRRLADRLPSTTVVDSLDAVPRPRRGVVIANELLDNLPAAVTVLRRDGWRERRVATDGDRLRLIETEAREEVRAWVDAHAGPVTEGAIVEAQLEATAWVRSVVASLDAGALLVVDYGDVAEGLRHRRAEGTIRTYRAHHLGPDPLLEPGRADITMDLNFTAMAAAAEAAGASVTVHRQDDFLTEWGLRDTIADLRDRELAAARRGDTMERLRIRSEITGAEALLHPRGLGDFRVMLAEK
jgi:SAM-dependent MidA family methyltransferase